MQLSNSHEPLPIVDVRHLIWKSSHRPDVVVPYNACSHTKAAVVAYVQEYLGNNPHQDFYRVEIQGVEAELYYIPDTQLLYNKTLFKTPFKLWLEEDTRLVH